MKREFFKISIVGVNTPKGCRKSRRYMQPLTEVATLDGIQDDKLVTLARSLVSRMNKVESCRIVVNKASEDDYNGTHETMVFVDVMPIKTINVEVTSV